MLTTGYRVEDATFVTLPSCRRFAYPSDRQWFCRLTPTGIFHSLSPSEFSNAIDSLALAARPPGTNSSSFFSQSSTQVDG